MEERRSRRASGIKTKAGFPYSFSGSTRRAFSLVEVMIAIFVITIGLMGLYGSMSYGLRMVDQGADSSRAVAYARKMMEMIRARTLAFSAPSVPPPANGGLNDAPDDRVPLNAAPFSADMPSDPTLTRNIKIDWVTTAAGDYRTDHLVKIVVQVFWNYRGQEKSVRLEGWEQKP